MEQNNFFQPEEPYFLETVLFTEGTQSITGLILNTESDTTPTKKILGITEEENQSLLAIIISENLINPRFFFRNKLYDEDSYFVSPENINFQVYSLEIIAENNEGENIIFTPEEPVTVYSLDGFVYSSHKYAECLPQSEIDGTTILKFYI